MDKRKQLLACINRLPEDGIETLLDAALKMMLPTPSKRPDCPHCRSKKVIKYGKKDGKQRFQCSACSKTFMLTTNTIMAESHQPVWAWEQLIKDTMNGLSIDHSAKALEISHQCAFDMRHKFLLALMDFMADNQTKLGEVSELDETYVLESYKGSKFSDSAIRKPRKHGAKAERPGISSEYICICTGIQRQGEPFAKTVNRAKPSTAELKEVFDGHIDSGTLILCDGLRGYQSLNLLTDCAVADVHSEEFTQQSFYNLNTVNRFHNFIKEQYRKYRGVATKYLNRYNSLFCAMYRNPEYTISVLTERLLCCGRRCFYHSIKDVRSSNLLVI